MQGSTPPIRQTNAVDDSSTPDEWAMGSAEAQPGGFDADDFRQLCRNDVPARQINPPPTVRMYSHARITENPSRSYLPSDSAGTPGSTIIPSISPIAPITYGEAAFSFSAETNT